MNSIRELLTQACVELREISSTPRLDAEILFSHSTGLSRIEIITRYSDPISGEEIETFRGYLNRRKAYEPVAYITGRKEFWGLDFEVSPDVLIPRPETELLVERALEILDDRTGVLKILDLGTGSGALAVALAVELKNQDRDFFITAVDNSASALEIARNNARHHGVAACVEFKQSDWFSALGEEKFNLIISNPPYVAEGDLNVSNEIHFEPPGSLFAGERGLRDIERLLREAGSFIQSTGRFLFEFGSSQTEEIENLCASLLSEGLPGFSKLSIHQDLSGLDRAGEVIFRDY